jgi:steroid delta-isomerase-like uncharacterized protein
MPALDVHRDNNQLMRALIAAWNEHDAEGVVACFAPDFVGIDVAEAAPQRGPRNLRQSVERYLRAFPDLQVTPDELLIEDTRAVLVWTVRGTHLGSLMRIPPTGRPILLRGATLFQIEQGAVRRATNIWDVAGFLRSVGLLPDLAIEPPGPSPPPAVLT